MNNRIDAIYARQSVDKKDSISIESQIEFCKYELKGGNCSSAVGFMSGRRMSNGTEIPGVLSWAWPAETEMSGVPS